MSNDQSRNEFLNLGDKVLKRASVSEIELSNKKYNQTVPPVRKASTVESSIRKTTVVETPLHKTNTVEEPITRKISSVEPSIASKDSSSKSTSLKSKIGIFIGCCLFLYGLYMLLDYLIGPVWASSISLILLGLIFLGAFLEEDDNKK